MEKTSRRYLNSSNYIFFLRMCAFTEEFNEILSTFLTNYCVSKQYVISRKQREEPDTTFKYRRQQNEDTKGIATSLLICLDRFI